MLKYTYVSYIASCHPYSNMLDIYAHRPTQIFTSAGQAVSVVAFVKDGKPIDDIICPLYGLTPEETAFIKNYELQFRISDDGD